MKQFALFLGVIFLAACTTVEVSQNFQSGVNFQSYQTYRWKSDALTRDNLVDVKMQQYDQMIRQSIDQELQMLGYRPTESETADLLIDYQLDLSESVQEIDVNEPNTAYVDDGRIVSGDGNVAYGPKWSWNQGERPKYQGWKGPEAKTIYYEKGDVRILMYDQNSKQLIWNGKANKVIDFHTSSERVQVTVNKGMKKLFKKFPK